MASIANNSVIPNEAKRQPSVVEGTCCFVRHHHNSSAGRARKPEAGSLKPLFLVIPTEAEAPAERSGETLCSRQAFSKQQRNFSIIPGNYTIPRFSSSNSYFVPRHTTPPFHKVRNVDLSMV